jgi:hypothetical protein
MDLLTFPVDTMNSFYTLIPPPVGGSLGVESKTFVVLPPKTSKKLIEHFSPNENRNAVNEVDA